MTVDLVNLQTHLANPLDSAATDAHRLAGIIGDRPSQYAKSPSLWNAVFRRLKLDAAFAPFDVDEPKLASVVAALRGMDRVLGFSVTVPYKVKIIPLLDALDEKARQIGAVNTVVRSDEGRLVGYNTDGSGFLTSLTGNDLPGQAPLLPSVEGAQAMLIGAGGAARAVAFYLAEAIGADGQLTIANRSADAAERLAADVGRAYGNARAIAEDEIPLIARSVSLLVNCSTKGQSGLRRVASDRVTLLEPYSALASAQPASLVDRPSESREDVARAIFEASLDDITRNNDLSAHTAVAIPRTTVGYDLVYDPRDTVFCRHLRWSGHRVANGKGMNIAQAADALFEKVCRGYLGGRGLLTADGYRQVVGIMSEVW